VLSACIKFVCGSFREGPIDSTLPSRRVATQPQGVGVERRDNGAMRMSNAATLPFPGSSALELNVLVLNRSFAAVHVTTVRRAIALLYRKIAEVVHAEQGSFAAYTIESWQELSALEALEPRPGQDWIKAVGYQLQAPRVIRLPRCESRPRHSMRFNRRNIFARDANRCQYCGQHFSTGELSLDHVIPKSQGGPTVWENIVCACVRCNVRKGGRTPKEARMHLVCQPTKPKRSPLLALKLHDPKYASWKTFVDRAYWLVDLDE